MITSRWSVQRVFIFMMVAYAPLINATTVRQVERIGPKTENVPLEKYAAVYYVSVANGSDKSGNGSQENPWQTINHAITTAASATKKAALQVAAGTYNHGTIMMHPLVDLFGGYDAATWQRNIDLNRTILDGEGVRRVVVGSDESRLDGFVITGGFALSHGGGILCDDTSPLITNNRIINNLVAEPAVFNHSRIHQDGIHGGGIACLYNAVPTIMNNLFAGNRTTIGNGAGVAFYGWVRLDGAPETEIDHNRMIGGIRAVLENNVFLENIAGMNDLSRTRSSNGGAISCAFEARPLIRNNLIIANEARGRSDAGGIYIEYFSYPLIEGNWIVGNIGDDDGGGIYLMKQSHPLIKDNIIAGNRTLGGGVGGIRLSKEGRATTVDNLILENSGGGLQCVDSYMEIERNIIVNHSDSYGLSVLSNFDYFKPSVIRDNIIRQNPKGALIVKKVSGTMPIIENNNLDDSDTGKGEGNHDHPLQPAAPVISGKVLKINYDSFLGQSRITTELPLKEDLAGRIFQLGGYWGVVRSSGENTIDLWGRIVISPAEDRYFNILETYGNPQIIEH